MDEMTGKVVRSLMGHDKGKLFIIVRTENNYAYLSDGKLRMLENPKKKKIKHLEISNFISKEIKEKIDSASRLNNSDIRDALESYKNKDAKGE